MLVLRTLQASQTVTIRLREPLWSTNAVISVLVKDFDGNELDAGTATYSSSTWTTATACGRGTGDPKIITVTSSTSLTTGQYFLVSAAGNFEKVTIVSIDGARVELATPLQSAYAIASTIKPATATYTVHADVVAAEVDFVMNVQYFINGGRVISYNLDGYVATTPAGCPVTLDDVYRIWPQLAAMQQTVTYGAEMQERLDAVWDIVRGRLASRSIKAEMFKSVSALRQVTIYEFGVMLALGGVDPSGNKDLVNFRDSINRIATQKWNELWVTEQFVDRESTEVKNDESIMDGRFIEW